MKNILKKSLISFFSVWGSVMILLFCIVLSGCSSTKKVEKTKSDIALNSEMGIKKIGLKSPEKEKFSNTNYTFLKG